MSARPGNTQILCEISASRSLRALSVHGNSAYFVVLSGRTKTIREKDPKSKVPCTYAEFSTSPSVSSFSMGKLPRLISRRYRREIGGRGVRGGGGRGGGGGGGGRRGGRESSGGGKGEIDRGRDRVGRRVREEGGV